MLRLLAGLDQPTGGELLAGAAPLSEAREDTRLMFQEARLLPWKKIIKAIENGTQFVGLSDFTALQTALLTKTATQPAVTWAGNLLIDDWGQIAEPDEITEACFSEMVQGSSEGAGWIISKKEQPETGTALLKKPVKNATLWGGNLCVLTSLLGTPYFPSIKKGVLFLEDVSEHPYRIERMLTQLLHAGVLDNQQAVILGQFTDFQTSTHDKGFNLRTVVQWLRSQTRTPILTGLPHGHVPTKVLLPVGATKAERMRRPSALRTGMFCRLGSLDANRPVTATACA